MAKQTPRKRLNLGDHIRQMQELNEKASEAEVEAALRDPAVAAKKVADLIEEWRHKTPPDFIRDDPEYHALCVQFSKELSIEMFITMKLALENISKQLQKQGDFIGTRDLASIMRDMGMLIKEFNKGATATPAGEHIRPGDTEALDQSIAQLEKELGIRPSSDD